MDFKPVELKDDAAVRQVSGNSKASFANLVPAQLKELFVIEHLKDLENRTKIEHLPAFRNFCENKSVPTHHFYYPWLNKIFKTVGPRDYFNLRTNRNRDLITLDEQQALSNFTVAVLGLSVGSNIAFLLTQAGISNKIFLADPDTLDTTNLNRLLTGVQDLGLNKAILASRRITESNPYAQPVPLTEGINEKLLESLLKSEKIHCIVEEVDALPVKVAVRKLARQYRVPVLMITDNGFSIVLHVERYDLGYDKIFEREIKYWEAMLKGGLDHQKISQIIIDDIFGSVDAIDKKLFASNLRILKKELVSWPQLGSTAMFGGAVATQMIKKIALKENTDIFIKKFINTGI